MVWVVLQGRLRGFSLGGQVAYDLEAESQTLSGKVIATRHGTFAAALHSSASAVEFFSPSELENMGVPPISKACGSTTIECRLVSLRTLSDGGTSLNLRKPRFIEVRHDSDGSPAQTYVSFDDDSRLAIAVIGIDGQLQETASGLIDTGTGPSMLSLSTDQSFLFAVDQSGAGFSIRTASTVASHVVTNFEVAVCPTALLARESDLLVASHCSSATAELKVVPVSGGGLETSAAVTLPLPCTPIRMAHTPSQGTDGPDAVLIGCQDSATVLVLGRD
jgi:hypothetical protein